MQQQIDRVTALAQQAAALLPEAPPEGDLQGYLAWRELVWHTALRLSDVAGPSLAHRAVGLEQLRADAPVTVHLLLDLACLVGRARGGAPGSTRPLDQRAEDEVLLQRVPVARCAAGRSATPRRAACGIGAARKGVRRC